ncbi:UvrD-helicase domain-containing protein [Kitasatospora purpeofusca]|uniref:UvrD-helicase domain-containing protein n=1 Tax=Kitasatospora purpeofusca TaxID=67352 RepID=UPI0035D638EB
MNDDTALVQSAAADRQLAAVHADAPLYVRACPGAGKTKVLVDRHSAVGPAGGSRRGRALISFTNAAADELHDRCVRAGRKNLTRFPHFIGTMDAFLWRFLVRPFIPTGAQRQHVLDWSHLNKVPVGPRGIPLSVFRFDYDPEHREVVASLNEEGRGLLNNAQHSEEFYLQQALKVRSAMVDRHGYMTGLEVRLEAMTNLSNPDTGEILRARFQELIVDEAQDCSYLTVRILERLHEVGLPLVIVADPDQAIYEWNQASPAHLTAFAERLPSRIDLTGNWRSTQAICDVAATWRHHDDSQPDIAVAEHRSQGHPLLLLPYATARDHRRHTALHGIGAAVTAYSSHADDLEIPHHEQLLLSWSLTGLPASQRATPAKPPRNRLLALAWAASSISHPSSGVRQAARAIAESTLLQYWFPAEQGSVDAIIKRLDLDHRRLRRSAGAFLMSLPPVDERSRSDWQTAALRKLKTHARPAAADPPAHYSLGRDKSNLPIAQAIGVAAPDTSQQTTSMRISTVHGVKGQEADAVLLSVQGRSMPEFLQAWESRSCRTSEVARVYYVALTRARQLLGLTYPQAHHKDVVSLLERLEIPHRSLAGSPSADDGTIALW